MISEIVSFFRERDDSEFLFPQILLLYLWTDTGNTLYLFLGFLGLTFLAIINGILKVIRRRAKEKDIGINRNMENALKEIKRLKSSRKPETYAFYLLSLSMIVLEALILVSIFTTLYLLLTSQIQNKILPVLLLVIISWSVLETFTEAFMTKGYWDFVKGLEKEMPGKSFIAEEET